jgi:two-component system, cell cycle response regulator
VSRKPDSGHKPRPRPTRAPLTLKASDNPDLTLEVMRRVKAPHRPVLVVMTGDELGKRVIVEKSLLIGRDPEADITLSDGLVSWHHAWIEDRGDSWTLVDLQSTNGTTVNGEKQPEFVLKPNDRIVFGGTAVSFELQDALEQAYNENLDQLLNTDDLSGLLVRRRFDNELGTMVELARQKKQSTALLVMDMDGIKQINDTHGHLFGAYVIGEAGKLIGRIIEGRGVGCRFGGDEYLAALPGLNREQAQLVGVEILEAVRNHAFNKDGIPLRPGISIGVAAFPEQASDALSLFHAADQAMYRAKQSGKNKVCI